MFKKIQNRPIRILLNTIVILAALPVTYWLFIYLLTPRYQFLESKPFYGKYLYNPYQNMDSSHWKAYNFQCQNMRIDKKNSKQEGYIPVYEHGYRFFRKTRQLCIGAESVQWMDFPFGQSLDMKQHTLNILQQHGRFAVPASYQSGYKVSNMHYLGGYRLLEVGSAHSTSFEHWDAALSTGHRVYGIGNGSFYTMINTDDVVADSVYAALDHGCAYTVEGTSDEPCLLTRCELVGDTLSVETSAPFIQKAEFIGQEGKVLKQMDQCQQAWYVIQPSDTYVRVKLTIDETTCLYLNPITRHSTAEPVDQPTAEINWPLTIIFYVVYVLTIILCIRRVARKKSSSS